MSSVIAYPPGPASCYRPLRTTVQGEGFQIESVVNFIRPASAGDVTTLGNGLAVNDILVEHGAIQGPVDGAVGLTLYFAGCGSYDGLHKITKIIDGVSGTRYLVIESTDYGSVVPAVLGTLVMWPPDYTMLCEVSIYYDMALPPAKVILRSTANTAGVFAFDVSGCIRDHFKTDISAFCKAIPGPAIAATAHGTTALFYKLRIVEIWDDPTDADPIDPWNGDWDVATDTDYRVAVNAIHPFAGNLLDWTDTTFAQFTPNGTPSTRNLLTNAPRGTILTNTGPKLTMGTADRFRVHVLTVPTAYTVTGLYLNIVDISSGSPSLVEQNAITVAGTHAAISIAIGPADLAAFMTVPSKYIAYITDVSNSSLIEPVEITVDSACKENLRPFGWLNKLGGIDRYTFTGREIGVTKYKRSTVTKPMGYGTGYDFAERVHKVEQDNVRTVSSGPVRDDVRRWLAEDMMGAAHMTVEVNSIVCPCIPLSAQVQAFKTPNGLRPVTIEYQAGVDNLSQSG